MKFTLTIELGNDAMRTADDIRDALRRTAFGARMSDDPDGDDSGTIRDINGNTVGKWEVTA